MFHAILHEVRARNNDGQVSIRTAQEPTELLGWLDDVQELIVCDACRSGGAIGALRRWEWPSDSLKTHCRSGSHDMTLPFVLALAERLGKLPRRVTVWGIEVGDVSPGVRLGKSICNALDQIVRAVADDLAVARSRLGEMHHA